MMEPNEWAVLSLVRRDVWILQSVSDFEATDLFFLACEWIDRAYWQSVIISPVDIFNMLFS